MEELEAAEETRRIAGLEELALLAHSMKGAVLTLGESPLLAFVEELEEIFAEAGAQRRWLREEEVARVEDLQEVLRRAMAQLAPTSSEPPTSPGGAEKQGEGSSSGRSERDRQGAGPLRVVLADDSPSARRVLHSILSAGGEFRVIGEACDGMEAVELTRALLPDVVVMDLAMPRMNGLEAARLIQDEVPTPILLVTALESIEGLDLEGEELDPDLVAVLPKPRLDPEGVSLQAREALFQRLRGLCHLSTRRRRGDSRGLLRVVPTPCPWSGPRYEVLLVEDSTTQADLLSNYLEDSGFDVRICRDASQGWSAALRKRPDLILCDVILPGGSGYDLCCALRASPETQDIPVVFLSARGSPMDMARGYAAGATAFLSKPWDPAALAPRVRGLIEASPSGPDMTREVEVRLRGETLWVDSRPERILRFLVEAMEDNARAQGHLEASRLRFVTASAEAGARDMDGGAAS